MGRCSIDNTPMTSFWKLIFVYEPFKKSWRFWIWCQHIIVDKLHGYACCDKNIKLKLKKTIKFHYENYEFKCLF